MYHRLTWHLVEQTGLRRDAMEYAFERLGQPRGAAAVSDAGAVAVFPERRMATWLPALCRDDTANEDLTRLAALLQHDSGWVRIPPKHWLGSGTGGRSSLWRKRWPNPNPKPTSATADGSRTRSTTIPARGGAERSFAALGKLGAVEHTPQIVAVLNDERAVLDVRHAAAQALDELGDAAALAALQEAALRHPFLSVRNVARDRAGTSPS